MANKPIINLGIAPDTGTGDSARRGGEKINNLFVDTYTLLGDNALVLDNTDPNYGLRSIFAENSYMVGELHPAGRWQRVIAKDGTATSRSDGSNPNVFYASRGEQLNINLAELADSDNNTARGGSLNTPVANARFQVILPIARAGDTVRIRDIDGTWGVPDIMGATRAKGIDVWTTPFNYKGTEPWGQAGVSDKHTCINNGSSANCHPRFAVDSDNENTPIDEDSEGISFTRQYSDLEFVYTGHNNGWVASGANTTLNPSTSNNSKIEFMNDDSDWQETGTDSDPTYTFIYMATSHEKLIPIVQLGEAKYDSAGDIIAYTTVITTIDVAVTNYTIPIRNSSSTISIVADDIIVTVDDNSRFAGRIIAVQGI